MGQEKKAGRGPPPRASSDRAQISNLACLISVCSTRYLIVQDILALLPSSGPQPGSAPYRGEVPWAGSRWPPQMFPPAQQGGVHVGGLISGACSVFSLCINTGIDISVSKPKKIDILINLNMIGKKIISGDGSRRPKAPRVLLAIWHFHFQWEC